MIRKNEGSSAFTPDVLEEYAAYGPWLEAMAKHETNNFQSAVFKDLKNMFGMKTPSRRPTTGTPSDRYEAGEYKGKHAPFLKFKNTKDSARDMVLYLREFNVPTSYQSHLDFFHRLKRNGYWTGDYNQYVKGVERYL